MTMAKTNGTKAAKKPKAPTKRSIKRGEEIVHYKRLLEENENRLAEKINAQGAPLSPTQLVTLGEVIEKQKAKLAELTGE